MLHPQLFVREQFQDGSENISDCTLHLHCCIHHIFSIELWFVRRPWRYSILELHVRNDDDDDGGAAPLSRSPCYGALEIVVSRHYCRLKALYSLFWTLSGIRPANRSRSGPKSVHMHRSRADNVHEIWARLVKWGRNGGGGSKVSPTPFFKAIRDDFSATSQRPIFAKFGHNM